MIWV
jgi:hypothetical protein